jgi:hypothetical protein
MAWLILRVYDDRQGKNLVELLKQPAKPRTPETEDIAQLAEQCSVEVHDGEGAAPRKTWPWTVVAYTSRSRDGIGNMRRTFAVSLAARPRP